MTVFDDRKELVYLLGKLSPAQRLDYLRWCCKVAPGNCGAKPYVKKTSTGNALECFFDLWAAAMNFGLDLDKAANELVRRVRRLR
jgi:hypothetical protein